MPFDISLTPSQFEYIAKPGATLTQAYDVVNNASTAVTLTSSVEAWAPKGFNGVVNYGSEYASPNVSFSLANADLALNQNFTLNPGEKRQLVLKIKSDPKTGFGDFYYTFFVNQISSPLNSSDNSSQISGRLGSHLLLSLSDSENPQNLLRIGHFSVQPRLKDSFLTPIVFNSQIDNPGDFYNKIDGEIKITKSGKDLTTLKLEPLNVLSHYSRSVLCSGNTACQINPPFWPGSYTAKLTVNGKTESLNFYVFPFSLLAGLIFLGVLSWLLVKKVYRPPVPRI